MNKNIKRVCVLASGGDAPGMNACIEGLYLFANQNGLEIFASKGGFEGLINDDLVRLSNDNATGISGKSGCVFKSARSPRLKTREGFQNTLNTLKRHKIEALVVIGGNGSYVGAGRFKSAGVNILFVPATIDNDVCFTKNSLGFSSACESTVQLIDQLKSTMETNNRDHVVQLMGRHCNALSETVGAATLADIIDMEGNRHTPKQVAQIFANNRKHGKTSNFMIMQEVKAENAVEESIVSAKFMEQLKTESKDDNIRMTTLGHLQRGATPSCRDRFLAIMYGRAIVDCILRGIFCVGVNMKSGNITFEEIQFAPIPQE